jgi:hypothetical protein
MKRILICLIYLAFFPLLVGTGYLILFNIIGSKETYSLSDVISTVFAAYRANAIPGIAVGVVDIALSGRGKWQGIGCAFAGSIAAVLGISSLTHLLGGWTDFLPFGTMGAVAATTCWWMSRMVSPEPTEKSGCNGNGNKDGCQLSADSCH